MKITSPNVFIGWLDFGEDDQRRAREYLSQFNTDNTLDELGFGVLRDAFADVFFPATNTIMTRTRYLVFIPRLCYAVEQAQLSGQAAARRLTELENMLRESLRNEESQYVIGAVSKDKLHRYPSSIYWSALKRLGIFTHSTWGLAYYQAHLAAFHAAMKAEKDDDGLLHLNNVDCHNWDKSLCDIFADGRSMSMSDKHFPESLNFNLTKSEARYLQGKFRGLAHTDKRPSIVSHLLEGRHADPFNYPWNTPYPAELELYVSHARCFSMFTRGATLQYFHLLQQERASRGIGKPTCDVRDVFSRWWEATRSNLAEWNLDEFFVLASGMDAVRRLNDKTFIQQWTQLNIQAAGPDEMFDNAEAHSRIRERERITRPTKSRLHHPEYLQRWNPPKQGDIDSMGTSMDTLCFGLDYRAWIGSTFVRDIMDGLAGAA